MTSPASRAGATTSGSSVDDRRAAYHGLKITPLSSSSALSASDAARSRVRLGEHEVARDVGRHAVANPHRHDASDGTLVLRCRGRPVSARRR